MKIGNAAIDEIGSLPVGDSPPHPETRAQATAAVAAEANDLPIELNEAVLDHIPAGRWGEPADLMGAAVFLAGRASDYVNGHILAVDGGYLVR